MSLSIDRQRRIVTLIRWVMFVALAYLTTAATASVGQLGLLAVVAASNVALARISDSRWEHQALLPTIAGLDAVVLVGAMWLGQGFARDFFFAYFALLAVVALAGQLRRAVAGTALVVGCYGAFMALEHGMHLLQSPELIGRLGFLFSVGVGYGGLLDASRSRMREAALQGQLVGWVSKLSVAFSEDFDAVDVIRQVLVDTQNAYPGSSRASLVQIEGHEVRVIGSSDDDDNGTFELTPERYPELVAVIDKGEPVVINDIRTDPVTESVREFVDDLPFTSLLLCPVHLADAEFGHVILRVARKGTSFSPSIVTTTQHVAEAIGIIFRQAKMREAMERSEKMEMVSQITSSVAHSFNGILSTVLVASQALRKGAQAHDEGSICGIPPCGDDAASRFDAIDLATKEGLTIVERLGAWTRLGTGDGGELTRTVLSPQALFEEAWRYASPVWAKRVQTRRLELEWESPEGELPPVSGNSAELREVLLNLILNAIDAMPKGGVMTLGVAAEGDHIVFSVRDTGTGISDDIVEQIFNPLFSTKGSAGTGLGLSLARSAAERHEGMIEVETTEGIGSCFKLRLPAAAATNVASEEQTEAAEPAVLPSDGRVLLVDPSELVRDVMVRFLQSSGFDVDVVTDLDEAEVMLDARSAYTGVVADAAIDLERARRFLGFVRQAQPQLEGRTILYSSGALSNEFKELHTEFGFAYFDRSAGLDGLREATAALTQHRPAA